jgi:hypothetical protein
MEGNECRLELGDVFRKNGNWTGGNSFRGLW